MSAQSQTAKKEGLCLWDLRIDNGQRFRSRHLAEIPICANEMIGQTASAEIQCDGELDGVERAQAMTHRMLSDQPLGFLIVEARHAGNI